MRISIIVIILLLFLILFISCTQSNTYDKKYGKSYNNVRISKGILPIPSSWNKYDYGDYIDYSNPQKKHSKPYRLTKRVFFKNGKIDSEVDCLYSNKTYFLKGEGNFNQEIIITYSYSEENLGRNPWHIRATFSQAKFLIELSISETNKILGIWGLPQIGKCTTPPTPRR